VAAVRALSAAVQAAEQERRPVEAAGARWLLGVAQQAAGRYGSALATLRAAWSPPPAKALAPYVATAIAEVYRHLGEHAEAAAWDRRGLDLAEGTAVAWPLLGLAADAIGRGDADEARQRLEAAAALVGGGDWRLEVRAGWVTAELALLTDRPRDAGEAAVQAVRRAETAAAPPYVAKGLLFHGVALAQAGDQAAAEVLTRAAGLAEGLGALPVAWPARAILGALLEQAGDQAGAAAAFAAAARTVQAIAADLDQQARVRWLAQPPVAAVIDAAGASA
jgi:tetratricopeptide (TPR) repeat protein